MIFGFRLPALLCASFLAACGDTPPQLLSIDAPTAEGRVNVRLQALELGDLSLPGYAVADEVAVETERGTITTVSSVIWADKPDRAISLELTRHLRALTGIRVAPAPWPFDQRPDAVLDLRFETLLARADGTYQVSGQYFLGRLDEGRERSGNFEVREPILQPATPLTISQARGRAISRLARDLAEDALP